MGIKGWTEAGPRCLPLARQMRYAAPCFVEHFGRYVLLEKIFGARRGKGFRSLR